MHDALARALDAGATVVTPNRRLARHLIDAYDRAQREAGRRAWASARVLPWGAWIAAMEDEAVAAGALAPRVRIAARAAALLWRNAIDADPVPTPDPDAMAALAAEAWEHVHAFGAGGESWRGWGERGDEPAAFARWASRYRASVTALGGSDAATAPERVAQAAGTNAGWHGARIVLAGFLELAPQQRRVVDALVDAGASVDEGRTLGDVAARPQRATFASPGQELHAALAWARRQVEQRADSRVCVVVPDLAQRLAHVRLAAIDVLGLPAAGDARSPSWNVSLGAPIDQVPLVAAALDLIALAWTGLDAGRAAALLRTAYLPGALGSARLARAEIERSWLEDGVDRVRLPEVARALERRDDPLAARLAGAAAVASRVRRATRHAWVDAWRAALGRAGWPGDRALGSDEHQAMGALDEHLRAFAALDAVGGRREIPADEAIGALGAQCAAAPFQPESPDAPIQILGLYEAVGLPFDALWIAGMNDETLPRAPRPHPLLPIDWQRERGVPRSDAGRELAHAQAVASWLLRAAPRVVVSHATSVDDRPASRATVFPAGTSLTLPSEPTTAQAMFASRPRLERVLDITAPALAPDERVKAGSGLIEAQSGCAFQALVSSRWRADPWPEAARSLTPLERGSLLHAALAAFWREVCDQASLVALQADAQRYADARGAAAATAIASVDQARLDRVPAAVRALERERLVRALGDWLAIDAARPPFAVLGVERDATLALGPLTLKLRLDRVDRLASGGVAIVDYKSGGVPGIAKWQADRPQAVQMALYTLAWRAANPGEPVRAAVLAQVKRGDAKAMGLYASDDDRFGTAPEHGDKAVVDWSALEARWEALMHGLATAFSQGAALPAPRETGLCRYCGRNALCRYGAPTADDEEGE